MFDFIAHGVTGLVLGSILLVAVHVAAIYMQKCRHKEERLVLKKRFKINLHHECECMDAFHDKECYITDLIQDRKNAIAANKRLIAMWELEALAKNLTKEKTLEGL